MTNTRFAALTLDEGIPALLAKYEERFDNVFPLPPSYRTSDVESLKAFAKAITSNLIGGIGYFYGTSIVDRGFAYDWDQEDDASGADEVEKGAKLTEPKALLTATPSRSFFPRGFYWFVEYHYSQLSTDCELLGMRDFIYCISVNGTMISGMKGIVGHSKSSLTNSNSLEILKDWIDLIDEDGWVGREQILGEEARSRVRHSPLGILYQRSEYSR